MQQNTFIAVDVGDLGLAATRGSKARVVGEIPAIGVKLTNIDHFRAGSAWEHRQRVSLSGAVISQRNRFLAHLGTSL